MESLGPNFLTRLFRLISHPIFILGFRILNELHFFELIFIKLYNVYAFISQMLFFVACSMVFGEKAEEDEKNEKYVLTALKTLLFYSVFTYFVAKTKDIWTSNQTRISLFQNWSFCEGLCKIAVEWAKAIIVILCLREQGIYFKPTIPYASTTLIYYLCTEKIFLEIFQALFRYFELECLENLEHLYIPLFLNIYTLAMSFSIELYLLTTEYGKFTLICSYFLLYIRLKDAYYNQWTLIKLEKQTYESFRNATPAELDEFDDICAICLNKMSKAKITPCNHFFHPNCLKECLKTSFLCPICKVNF